MIKLKASEIKLWRVRKHHEQGGRCAITHMTISPEVAVADHDHRTGHMRGVLHRGANSLLGKLENNYKRFGLDRGQLIAFLKGAPAYLERDWTSNPLHNTYKSEDEKRIRRNKLARERRAKLKGE